MTRPGRRAFIWLTAAVLLAASCSSASAGPPGYLVLRPAAVPVHGAVGAEDPGAGVDDAGPVAQRHGAAGAVVVEVRRPGGAQGAAVEVHRVGVVGVEGQRPVGLQGAAAGEDRARLPPRRRPPV